MASREVFSGMCSEAIWQRCWASASDAKLRVGAIWGALQVTVVVFIFGFGGFLAVWSGLWQPSGPDDPGNTILFALLNAKGQQVSSTHLISHFSHKCCEQNDMHAVEITLLAMHGMILCLMHA